MRSAPASPVALTHSSSTRLLRLSGNLVNQCEHLGLLLCGESAAPLPAPLPGAIKYEQRWHRLEAEPIIRRVGHSAIRLEAMRVFCDQIEYREDAALGQEDEPAALPVHV